MQYRDEAHRDLPHIVSFSGGRSSAALAFMAADEGLIRPERGDLLLFANTSAEHPGTHEFAAEANNSQLTPEPADLTDTGGEEAW